MQKPQKPELYRLLPPLGLSSLMLVILFCALSQAAEAEHSTPSEAILRTEDYLGPLNHQTGVSICQQAQNKVPNPSFEEGSGNPWEPDHWYADGDCLFSYHDPGLDSSRSVKIYTTVPLTEICRVRTEPYQDTIEVEPNRVYDYSIRVKTGISGLLQGKAFLRIVFLDEIEEYVGITTSPPVTDTQDTWITVTGSVMAPADARFAIVDAFLSKSSIGEVWFDDAFLGLATCLEISKSDNPDPVAPGQILTYTITYRNTSREKATDVQIIETYDDRVTFVDANPDPRVGTNNHWDIPKLLTNTPQNTITVWVTVDSKARGWLTNQVQISSEEITRPVFATAPTKVESVVPVTDVIIDGPTLGTPNTEYTFTAIVSPSTATLPITYVWRTTEQQPITITNGNTHSYTWGTTGTRSITVTATNAEGTATSPRHEITITSTIPLTNVIIQGPTIGTTGTVYIFTATVSPTTATPPITYAWQTTEKSPVTHTSDLSDRVTFTWYVTGIHTITVTAVNAGGTATATDNHTITITSTVPLTNVVIDGPTTGCVDTEHTFTATVSPTTATPPITYVWQATGQGSAVTHTNGGLSDTVPFTWSIPGTQTIIVTVTNVNGTATATHVINIECKIYLPVIMRCWPPINAPTLDSITPPEDNASYAVSWSFIQGATTYVLEEATNSDFSDATPIYIGSSTSHSVDSRCIEHYYYHVQACNSCMCSGWSPSQSVAVRWECEPNNSRSQADGPLISGLEYYGYPNDIDDVFKIHLDSNGQVHAILENHTGSGVQLLLHDPLEECRDWERPYEITCNVPVSGTYYIRIYTVSGHNSNTPYTLQATFP